MLSSFRRNVATLPPPAVAVVAALVFAVPLTAYMSWYLEDWQTDRWPELALAHPYFEIARVGRCCGSLALAGLLIGWRSPASVAVAVASVWLAGPPVDFLLAGLRLLALSQGRVSWQEGSLVGLAPTFLLPVFVTVALLAPKVVRRTYGFAEMGSAKPL